MCVTKRENVWQWNSYTATLFILHLCVLKAEITTDYCLQIYLKYGQHWMSDWTSKLNLTWMSKWPTWSNPPQRKGSKEQTTVIWENEKTRHTTSWEMRQNTWMHRINLVLHSSNNQNTSWYVQVDFEWTLLLNCSISLLTCQQGMFQIEGASHLFTTISLSRGAAAACENIWIIWVALRELSELWESNHDDIITIMMSSGLSQLELETSNL